MAKASKVRGVKVFLTEQEAAGLAKLLDYGVDYSTRDDLNLSGLSEILTSVAPYRSFAFGTKASKEVPEE